MNKAMVSEAYSLLTVFFKAALIPYTGITCTTLGSTIDIQKLVWCIIMHNATVMEFVVKIFWSGVMWFYLEEALPIKNSYTAGKFQTVLKMFASSCHPSEVVGGLRQVSQNCRQSVTDFR